MEQRLQKLLSAYGVASRREAERMIGDGRVLVNGRVAQLGDRADDAVDAVEVDGRPLKSRPPERVYVMLHKPRGFVTTLHDERGRRTVADLLAGCPERVYPVGRLDCASEGLLLLTNDGEAANRLTHPSHEVEKVYLCWVSRFHPGAEDVLRAPMSLDGRPLAPVKLRVLRREGETALLEFTLREGRNRQIRRMCERAGLTVTRLRRIAEGPIRLGDLPPGKWRYLSEDEVRYMQNR